MYRFQHQDGNNRRERNNGSGNFFLRYVFRLLVTFNVVPRSPINVTLIMKATYSSETSVPTTATQRNIPEDDIPHSHRRQNLYPYMGLLKKFGAV
jgi:hypothetical protein